MKHGYIPWFHLDNICDPSDAFYYTEQNVLPVFLPGSPGAAPIPHGRGLRRASTLVPRAEALRRGF